MKTKALLIIDVQAALFNWTLPLYQENEVIGNIQALLEMARQRNYPIIYIQHTDKEGLFRKHTASWQIHAAISPRNNDYVIEKTSWDSFLNTPLKETLEVLQVDHLIIAGMQTEFCLDTTIRNAYSHGYQMTVCHDAHTTFDHGDLKAHQIINHHNSIWHNRFAQVVKTADVIR